jgi:hypothetical protein
MTIQSFSQFLSEHIIKTNSGYRLVSKKTGKNLGDFKTKEEAQKHEQEVEYFKHMNESMKTIHEFLEANREALDNALNEEIHPDIMNAAGGDYGRSRLNNVTKVARNLIKQGTDTGLLDDKPKKGSSRAVFFPKDDVEAKVDGVQTKIPHVMKIAFHGKLDSYTKDNQGLLGESQNDHEIAISHHYSMLRPTGQGEYETNHEGFMPPLLDHHETGSWMTVGKVSKLGSGDFRNLTKTKEFPKGISHADFYDAVNHHWHQSNGENYWGGTDEKNEKNFEHPLVQRALNFSLDTDTNPGDFVKSNMGVWTHPVTGEKHIVTSDAGFSRNVARRYMKARQNQAINRNRW